jgi:hypothetical protein
MKKQNHSQPLTKEDLGKIFSEKISHLATKQDLEKLVTNDSFEVASKKLVTKEDFEDGIGKLVTKDIFHKTTARLAGEIMRVSSRIDRLEQKAATKEDINRVMNHIDSIVGKTRNIETEQLAHAHRINQLREKAAQHGHRISAIERRSS